tara:strand:- start:5465 stop:6757 length:1293 start_codon:yes stop_codon:yes gene_type:complete
MNNMEELFFHKNNYDVLYSVLNDDVKENFKLSLTDLPINIGDVIYDSMTQVFFHKNAADNIGVLNRNVLSSCIRYLINEMSQKNIADEELNVFKTDAIKDTKRSITTSPSNKITYSKIEDLNGSVPIEDLNGSVPNQIVSKFENNERGKIEYEIDINTSDRAKWSTNATDNAFNFVVNYGVSSSFPGISSPLVLKNVVSLEIGHVILPATDYNMVLQYPFLYLLIDEFPGIQHSTSEKGRRALTKLIRDKKWIETEDDNVRYVLMNTRSVGSGASVGWFSDKPIISINKMTISILTPNGYPLKTEQDVFELENIVDDNDVIQIFTPNTFSTSTFYVGNRLAFQRVDSNNLALNTYLEENEHIIVEISNLENRINIQKQSSSFDSSGNFIYESYSNINVQSGMLMNISLQSSFGFNLKSELYSMEQNSVLN